MKVIKKIKNLFKEEDEVLKRLEKLQKNIFSNRIRFEEAKRISDLYLEDPQMFKKEFIPFKEYDKLLEQFENLTMELNHYKKQNKELKAKNNYLRNKLKTANTLLKESYLLINKLEDQITRKAIECLQSVASVFSRPQKIEVVEIKKEIAEAKKEKSRLRSLMEEALKKNLSIDVKSKQTDISNEKDWTINHKV